MAEKKAFKLDIFAILSQLEKGNLHLYETLNEEEQKSLSAYIVSQWMYGTTEPMQIILLNELVNPFIFSFSKHPELLVKLMACCGTRCNRRFAWTPLPKKKKEAKISVKVLMDYYGFSEREAIGNIGLLSNETIIELADSLGYTKEDIVKLKKELKSL